MFAMPRTRSFILALITLLGVLSYLSFDSYIRPAVIGVSRPHGSSPPNASPPSSPPTEEVSIPSPQATSSTPNVLLVSAFFPLSKSKHPIEYYRKWLANFLTHITTPLYFYTTPDMEPLIRQLRGNLPITINTTYESPFEIDPLATEEMVTMYINMRKADREKGRHSPELYATWTAKPFFLHEGLQMAESSIPPSHRKSTGKPYYDYAFWVDAGSFRLPHSYKTWPEPARVDEVFSEGAKVEGMVGKEDLIFFPILDVPDRSMQFWGEGMGPIDNDFSEGSFFGGSPKAIQWWRKMYFKYHDHYINQNVFVGKDQTLINALLVIFPKRFITVWASDPIPPPPLSNQKRDFIDYLPGTSAPTPHGACGSVWYYYQFFFASPSERALMIRRWGNGGMFSWGGFRPWTLGWWSGGNRDPNDHGDGRCRLGAVQGMQVLLRRVFGNGWNSPGSGLAR